MMSPNNFGSSFLLTIQTVTLYYFIIYNVQISEGKQSLIFLNGSATQDVAVQISMQTQKPKQECVTQTVYGFLDFTTTIGNTVMIFSPKSTTSQEISSVKTHSHFEINSNSISTPIQDIIPSKTSKEISNHNPIITTGLDVILGSTSITYIAKPSKLSSKVEIITSYQNSIKTDKDETFYVENEEVISIGNVLDEPEYDFLSRQPSEFVEETFKIMNLKSSGTVQPKTRSSTSSKKSEFNKMKSNFPTGLVTKVGGTVVKDGATTIHETSVIGTYISGKYAQVLQSSSQVFKHNKPKISTSPTSKVLKTNPPSLLLNNRYRVESKIEEQENSAIRSTRRPAIIGNFKKGFRNQTKEDTYSKKVDNVIISSEQSVNKSPRRVKPKSRRNKNSRNTLHNKSSTTVITLPPDSPTRRNFKAKHHQISAIEILPSEQTSLYKFKLNRTPGRWQYKTSSKPRIAIRKTSNSGDDQTKINSIILPNSEIITNDIPKRNYNSTSDETDLESSGSISGAIFNDVETGNAKIDELDRKYPIETLNVEISTAVDLKDTYYEIATIKTPYLFQVGTLKRTRYITVTSTFEKTFEPEQSSTLLSNEPLTENILTSSTQIDRDQSIIESSIATLPPLYLSSDEETPPIETRVESFSTTQLILKTDILPIIRYDSNTTSITLIQTYRITRYVTATKTLPPIEAYDFVPSQHLKEFNSKLDEAGSELNIELDFGDENGNNEDNSRIRQILPDSDIREIGSTFDLIGAKEIKAASPKLQEVNKNNGAGDQLRQLALLGLLNPGSEQLQHFVNTPNPMLKYEVVYKTEIIPIFNGHSTSFSTITRPITTIKKSAYELPSTVFPPLQMQIPQPLNPLFAQQYHLTTAPVISQTVVTETRSKVLKLTFGAKTAYTTLFSTNVIPTILTTYVTTSIQVHPTAALPGYYPAGYPPYPFIG